MSDTNTVSRRTQGRYGRDVRKASEPGELPREGALRPKVLVAHGAVADPNPTRPGERQRVAINLRTDVLEQEYYHKRISEAGYRAATRYQAVLERAANNPCGSGPWRQGDRIDVIVAHELAIVHGLDNARAAIAMLDETAPILGAAGQRVMHLVLVERKMLTQAAPSLRGYGIGGTRASQIVGWLFRSSCELLADHWSAQAPGAQGRIRADRDCAPTADLSTLPDESVD